MLRSHIASMNAMVKPHKVRCLIHPAPAQRAAVRETFAHRRLLPDLGMAGHACLRGRNASNRRPLHAGMAKPAIDSRSMLMMLIAQRHGLFQRRLFACHPRRQINPVQTPLTPDTTENSANKVPRNALAPIWVFPSGSKAICKSLQVRCATCKDQRDCPHIPPVACPNQTLTRVDRRKCAFNLPRKKSAQTAPTAQPRLYRFRIP